MEWFLSAELTGQINLYLKRANKYGFFKNKIQSGDEIAMETTIAMETLFLIMKCKQCHKARD